MTLRVLCSGDIHIGRQLSKVEGTYRTVDAWNAIVDLAITEDVDLLALSGDVIDKANSSFEALGPVQHGLLRLDEAGIETVAVAGNHDHDVLTRLADIVGTGRFHLLGAGGVWERYTLDRDGVPILHIDGWSFPAEHTTDAPLRRYRVHTRDDAPVMGLLHGDVGVLLSSYAPINEAELWSHDIDFVLLGHIHAPRIFEGAGGQLALYPGSPWAMDPGEPGVHGVWIATFEPGQAIDVKQIAISPVRYETRGIDLTGVEDEQGFQQKLSETLNALGQEALEADGVDALQTISVRLRSEGECIVHRSVSAWIATVLNGSHGFPLGPIVIAIEAFSNQVRPPVDLENLAQGTDPLAETAKLILALDSERPSAIYRDLVATTHRDLIRIHENVSYARLREGVGVETPPTDADARSFLSQRAWEMLSALVAQKEIV